jgi:hypothetical protein
MLTAGSTSSSSYASLKASNTAGPDAHNARMNTIRDKVYQANDVTPTESNKISPILAAGTLLNNVPALVLGVLVGDGVPGWVRSSSSSRARVGVAARSG